MLIDFRMSKNKLSQIWKKIKSDLQSSTTDQSDGDSGHCAQAFAIYA